MALERKQQNFILAKNKITEEGFSDDRSSCAMLCFPFFLVFRGDEAFDVHLCVALMGA